MSQATSRQTPSTPQQGRGPGAGKEPPGGTTERAIDHERLVWDPEYRREVARLLRQPPSQGS